MLTHHRWWSMAGVGGWGVEMAMLRMAFWRPLGCCFPPPTIAILHAQLRQVTACGIWPFSLLQLKNEFGFGSLPS